MLRHRFGQKSARYIDPNDPQMSLYETYDLQEVLPEDDVEDGIGEKEDDSPSRQKRKPSNKRFADHLPRIEKIVSIAEYDRICQCGCQKKFMTTGSDYFWLLCLD